MALQPSNLKSNFSNTTSVLDILSTISNQATVNIKVDNNTGTMKARYFYLGPYLIQFSDNVGTNTRDFGITVSNYIDFPIAFSSTPWCVVACGAKNATSGTPVIVIVTLLDFTNTQFRFAVNSNGGSITYIAIGPR